MASDAPAAPLAIMDRLSETTFLYRPKEAAPETTRTGPPPPPRLILVCAWMDAKDVHIAKYVARHRDLFPGSPILLIKCDWAHLRNPARASAEMAPALDVLRATFPAPSPSAAAVGGQVQPELLIHLFSNAGVFTLFHLLTAYRDTPGPPSSTAAAAAAAPLPAHVVAYDSAPGIVSYRRGMALLRRNFASPVLRWLAAPFLHAAMLWFWLVQRAWSGDAFERRGRALNDGVLAGPAEARRVYLYSEADELVGYDTVEAHAADAEEKGFAVRRVKFEGSAHVAHARAHEVRYWAAVKELWAGDGGGDGGLR